uniref:Uncharacterized protein n=1 Tax=Acrobeloides nanus TaxID=290746 RepID=A0A914DN92_9BILA
MREQDKARSQLNGQLIKDMKDQLMKAVAENIAETVRQAYRIEVVPVASTLNGVIQQTPHLRSRQNGASINDESRKRLSATVTTPLKRLQRTSNVISRTPVIRKLPYCAHKHRRCSACNPNFK